MAYITSVGAEFPAALPSIVVALDDETNTQQAGEYQAEAEDHNKLGREIRSICEQLGISLANVVKTSDHTTAAHDLLGIAYSSLGGIPATFPPQSHSTGSHSDWPAAVSMAEVGYLDGLVEALSVSLAGKAASGTFATHKHTGADGSAGGVPFTALDFTGSSLSSLATRAVANLSDGSTVMRNNANDAFTGKLYGPDGTAALPTYAFSNAQNSGMYSPASGRIAFATNGVPRLVINQFGTFSFGSSSLLTNGSYGSSRTECRIYPDQPNSGDWRWQTPTIPTAMVFSTAGRLGIGSGFTATITIPTWRLDILEDTAASGAFRVNQRSTGPIASLQDNGTERFGILDGRNPQFTTPIVPAASGSPGSAGEVAWDGGYIYVCTGASAWARAAIAAW